MADDGGIDELDNMLDEALDAAKQGKPPDAGGDGGAPADKAQAADKAQVPDKAQAPSKDDRD
eukprot:CAMPEP_0198569278 /NCGR_PEP_ID=MMETSP1462-20131121/107581_1 /TAXON_ID=1333877 /ORGANISM="Brandtodinium nutriculum, Strain RCC3387" /LENGTH=61 /DNA_ID=CAMNT_0044300365 /DNA_START=17 /DNA_END=199 /DNA_ORIENTATION=-